MALTPQAQKALHAPKEKFRAICVEVVDPPGIVILGDYPDVDAAKDRAKSWRKRSRLPVIGKVFNSDGECVFTTDPPVRKRAPRGRYRVVVFDYYLPDENGNPFEKLQGDFGDFEQAIQSADAEDGVYSSARVFDDNGKVVHSTSTAHIE